MKIAFLSIIDIGKLQLWKKKKQSQHVATIFVNDYISTLGRTRDNFIAGSLMETIKQQDQHKVTESSLDQGFYKPLCCFKGESNKGEKLSSIHYLTGSFKTKHRV